MRLAAVLLPLAVLVGPQETDESCCHDASATPLPPLPADATEKERWLRRLHDEAPRDARNVFLSTATENAWRDRLAKLPADAPLAERYGLRYSLGLAALRSGHVDEAIRLAEECVRLADVNASEAAGWLPESLFRLAVARFRDAEKRNCILRHNEDSCLFPLSPRAAHVERGGAEGARAALERLLALPLADAGVEHRDAAAWLLNVANMALGSWPAGVPEAWRLPPERLASSAPMPRFVDRAKAWGLARHNHAGSVAIDDFTGDGRLDVLVVSFDTGKPPSLFRNEGGRRFTDVAEAAGLARQLGGIALATGDVDGDGRLDVLVLRGGGFLCGAEMPSSLLRQDAPGHFVDVTRDAGIEIAAPSRAAAFADVDRDGDLDLFVGYETEPDAQGGLRFPSRLFLNDGRGRFAIATERSGIVNPESCSGAVFGDVDADGDPDLLVVNVRAASRLFVNRGDGTFRDESKERGVAATATVGPAGFLDADGDGDLDLYLALAHHHAPVSGVAAYYFRGEVDEDTQRLLENDGKGNFRDVTDARGLRRVAVAAGLGLGDVDDDGLEDVFVATGSHDFAALFPKVLLKSGPRFEDVTFAANVGHLQKGNAAAFGDLDGDGDLDLFAQLGGWFPDDAFSNALFENPGTAGRHLEVDLVGARDNRFGVGSRVRARVAAPGGERDAYAFVGARSTTGCGPTRAHLGLGDATAILFVEVAWPASGATERVEGPVPLDATIRIRQGEGRFETLAPGAAPK